VTALHFGAMQPSRARFRGLSFLRRPENPASGIRFDQNRSSWKQAIAYRDYVACFVFGHAHRTTARGAARVELLREGDLVLTRGGKSRLPIRWEPGWVAPG